jgi:hypothetical protein
LVTGKVGIPTFRFLCVTSLSGPHRFGPCDFTQEISQVDQGCGGPSSAPRPSPPRMAPKRKAPAAPAAAAPAKAAKGDGKAKGGRPTAAAQLAKQAPAAGTPAADRSIAFMFGARTPAAAKAPTAFTADLKKWQYSGIGGEEAITQKQVIGGPVLCMLETPPQRCKRRAFRCSSSSGHARACRCGWWHPHVSAVRSAM